MILCTSSKCYLLCSCQQIILSSNIGLQHTNVTPEIGKAKVSQVNLSVNWRRNWTSEKTQDHLDICAADGTFTSLTFHLIRAGLTKTLVATWHKRDTCIALSHEAYLAVVHVAGSWLVWRRSRRRPKTFSISVPELLLATLLRRRFWFMLNIVMSLKLR